MNKIGQPAWKGGKQGWSSCKRFLMTSESIFQITCILLFLPLGGIGLYHRIKAAQSGENISRREEGMPIMILLRLFGFATWLALITYMINPRWMAWSALELANGWRWFGAGLCLIAIPLIYWMFSSLGKNITDTVAIRKQHQLVTHGPYRWVRHPMYSFSFIFFIGFALLTANWFIGITGMTALIIIIFRTPKEEEKLIEQFGKSYLEYQRRTGRFFPRIF